MIKMQPGIGYGGIDPGVFGALGVIWFPKNNGGRAKIYVARFHDLTMLEVADFLRDIKEAGELRLMVEKAGARPKQGVASSFKFGIQFGKILGVLAAVKQRYFLVSPGTWQRALGCLSRGDKSVTRQKAQELFPEGFYRVMQSSLERQMRVTNQDADALLIAQYAMTKIDRQIENKEIAERLKKIGYKRMPAI